MATLRISPDVWRHTRAFQETLEEGRAEGLREGRDQGRRGEAGTLALRQLERRCGSLPPAITAQIEALDLPQLEELALALLDFENPEDLTDWLSQRER